MICMLGETLQQNSIQTVAQLSLTISRQIYGETLQENTEPKDVKTGDLVRRYSMCIVKAFSQAGMDQPEADKQMEYW